MSTLEQWFPYRRGGGRVELFAFPHVGAGPTLFHPLRSALRDEQIDLTAALLPGRGRRLREPAHTTVTGLVAALGDAAARDGFRAFTGAYALFGQCFGALVAYEVAQLLVAAPCADPQLLVVCSCAAPAMIRDTGTSLLPSDALFARTAALGGTAGQLLTDPDVRAMLEPGMRADWAMFDGYVDRTAARLPVPILAVRGTEDATLSPADVRLWQHQTSVPLATAEVDADHWVVTDRGSPPLARSIAATLAVLNTA